MIKRFAQCIFLCLALPFWVWWKLFALLLGNRRVFMGVSQLLALFPGTTGSYLRSAFYRLALPRTSQDTIIEFLTTFSHPGASIGPRSSISAYCNIGFAEIEAECGVGAYVVIASGRHQHAFGDVHTSIWDQGGQFEKVRLGKGCLIFHGSLILADVGEGAVVAAGSVVTKPVPAYSVVAGVPARVIRSRLEGDPSGNGTPEEAAP